MHAPRDQPGVSAYRHRTLFAAACVGMLLVGIVMTTLGAVLPSVTHQLGIDRTAGGSLLALMSIGILCGSLIFGPVVDRYGYRGMLAAAVVVVAIGLEGIAFAPTVGLLAGAAFLIGFGGGIVNGAANALVADINPSGRAAGLSYLGVFFGLGALSVPLVLGMLRDRFGDAGVVAGIGVVVMFVPAFYAAIRFPQPKQPQGFPLRDAAGMLRDPVLVMLSLVLFLESGMELTMAGWTATYAHEELRLTTEGALVLLSLYWVGMTGARVAQGWLLRHVAAHAVLLASMGTALLGATALIGARTPMSAGIGTVMIGGGLAAVFPIILGYVGDRYPHMSGTAFGVAFTVALAGGTVMPWVVGLLGDAVGLRISLATVPACLLGAAALFLAVRPHLRPHAAGGN